MAASRIGGKADKAKVKVQIEGEFQGPGTFVGGGMRLPDAQTLPGLTQNAPLAWPNCSGPHQRYVEITENMDIIGIPNPPTPASRLYAEVFAAAWMDLNVSGSTLVSFTIASAAAVAAFPGHYEARNSGPDFSKWAPTDPANSAPCPFTNSLANHGFLSRTAMTKENINSALENVLLMDAALSNVFSTASMPLGTKLPNGTAVVSLAQLDVHGGIEHDASLTRSDTALGDNTAFNETLFEQLLSYSSDGVYITLDELAKFRAAREKHSKAMNPSFSFGPKPQFTAYGEAALLYFSMKDETDKIRVDWIKVLFREERFPVELGWKPKPMSFFTIVGLIADIRVRAATGL
ncbi:hypothetical protein HK101_011156 [Irineochytrium annulatum]|nr:hypothetical protein HK101_011156 [Irineochytrium annulatum]